MKLFAIFTIFVGAVLAQETTVAPVAAVVVDDEQQRARPDI